MSDQKGVRKPVLIAFIVITVILLLISSVYLFIITAYPLKYEEIIRECSDEYGVDPYLVAAIICTESGFRSDAKSNKGAVGLMQIMPDTGEWLAGKIGLKGYNASMLEDPETNIALGSWYIKYLSDRFGGDMDLIAAAYNAGQNKVSEWLGDERYSRDGALIEIPYEETDNYVKKVNTAYEIYKMLYEI